MRVFHVVTILALLAVAGCVHPYKIEVLQGNAVTQEMLEKLKPGLTKSQVRYVLGTPLITDPFHPQRWDYIYMYKQHAAAPAETRRLTVIFEGDTLVRVEGDLAPDAAAGGEPPGGGAGERIPSAEQSSQAARSL